MLCVQALQDAKITPESGEILVTGASGGVGSVAVYLLARLGYKVVASSGRVEQNSELLLSLGASEVIERSELEQDSRPLEKQRWAGIVDTVGNKVLATALAQMRGSQEFITIGMRHNSRINQGLHIIADGYGRVRIMQVIR